MWDETDVMSLILNLAPGLFFSDDDNISFSNFRAFWFKNLREQKSLTIPSVAPKTINNDTTRRWSADMMREKPKK